MGKHLEVLLRDYFTENNGKNLSLIKKGLKLIEPEHTFPGGRIDILASYYNHPVAIELKANNYSTQMVCAQLMNYLNFVSDKKGLVFFVAPKVKFGVYSTLKNYYEQNKMELYEFEVGKKNLTVHQKKPSQLDDSRQIKFLNDLHEESCNKNVDNKDFYDFLLKTSVKQRYSEQARTIAECIANPTTTNLFMAYLSLNSDKKSFVSFLKDTML